MAIVGASIPVTPDNAVTRITKPVLALASSRIWTSKLKTTIIPTNFKAGRTENAWYCACPWLVSDLNNKIKILPKTKPNIDTAAIIGNATLNNSLFARSRNEATIIKLTAFETIAAPPNRTFSPFSLDLVAKEIIPEVEEIKPENIEVKNIPTFSPVILLKIYPSKLIPEIITTINHIWNGLPSVKLCNELWSKFVIPRRLVKSKIVKTLFGNIGSITNAIKPNLNTSITSLCSILLIYFPKPRFWDKKKAISTNMTSTISNLIIPEVVKNPSINVITIAISVVIPNASFIFIFIK